MTIIKRTLLSMMLAATTLCGWAADGDKTLKVKLDIIDFGDSVTVVYSGKDQTFTGKDGKFEFEMAIDNICEGYFVMPKLLRGDMEDARMFRVPLVGGEEMRLWQTDRKRYDVDGTGFYVDYHQVDLYNEKASADVRANLVKYRKMRDNSTFSKSDQEKFYKNVYLESYNRYQEALVHYIKEHAKMEAAIMLLKDIDGLDKMKEAYTLFDPSVREGRMKPLFDSWVSDAEKRIQEEAEEKEAAKKQAAGLEAPVFTLNDINGNPLTLSSLRGKYVVLDFWGSWCVWCIKGFPKMKEYYAKYPGKFEILGVDCKDTEDKWKAAVKKHELPWLHVYSPKGSTILDDYGVTGFPTKIIIGPDGKIFKTIVGEDPSFYTLLDELFGK
ncbi:MAG: TlpA family protein disulfide reductase [Prevotella sp.]|nr:TlpA family protein disulfide reductase [Prevotella sp.]